ncbi:MAG: hypothetical protein WC162_02070 [Sphaerochaetaceae bacterium]
MKEKKKFLIVLTIVILVIFNSCFLFPPDIPIVDDNNGSMLVQYGDYVYRIGGYNSEGIATTSIFKSKIRVEDGEVIIGDWSEELDLPTPRAYGAAFAAGDFLHVIGGEDEYGPVKTVLTTQISSDGTLGSGGGLKFWTSQDIKLPQPRSHMSLAYNDGRIFLIGGKNGDKIFDTILQARIQIGMSGHIGHWNTAPVSLLKPLYDTSAIINQDKLYIAGGLSNLYISNRFFSYQINEYGRLSDLNDSLSDIPKYLIKPIMVNSLDSITIGGGYIHDDENNSNWYKYNGSSWDLLDYNLSGEGPVSAQARNSIIILDPDKNNTLVSADFDLPPSKPKIYPGSGVVRTNSNIIGETNSWSDLSYIKNSDTTSHSYSEPFEIVEESTYQFKNSDGINITQGYSLSYKVKSLGWNLSITDRLHVEDSTVETLSTLEFNDKEQWYNLALYEQKNVLIQWADSTDDSSYTSNALITFYEEDFCTEVLDNEGFPIAEPSSIDTGKSGIRQWEVTLNPGTYYLHIIDADDDFGGTIGFLISEVSS